MSKRPLLGHSDDSTPWRGDGGSPPREKLLAGHEVDLVAGIYQCTGCAFVSSDIGEAISHLVRSQYAVASGHLRAGGRPPVDDGGPA